MIDVMPVEIPFSKTISDRFEVLEPLVRGKRTLDVGCVDARPQKHSAEQRFDYKVNLLHKRLHEINPQVVGLDIDQAGVDVLRSNGYDVICDDVETMKLGRTFETIVAGEIIEHLENPGLFLRNMRRHLEPGGVIVVSTPNPFYVGSTWKIWRYGRPAVHEDHMGWQDPITLDHILKRTGFDPIDGYWISPKSNPIKTWKRFVRPYFSHTFLMVARRTNAD